MSNRIWVEIIRGKCRGRRGWHDGTMSRDLSSRFVVHMPGYDFPGDAISKKPSDLRPLSEVEVRVEGLLDELRRIRA